MEVYMTLFEKVVKRSPQLQQPMDSSAQKNTVCSLSPPTFSVGNVRDLVIRLRSLSCMCFLLYHILTNLSYTIIYILYRCSQDYGKRII